MVILVDKTVSMPKNPQLSVIIASYNSVRTIERCLQSLNNQITPKNFEIIVVDSSKDGTAELVEERFHQVRLYRFSKRKFCGDARNFGISVARAKIIAFIDADCKVDRNWVNEILKAHQFPHVAIGGAVANGNPESYLGWAAYFCEFSQWMPSRYTRWLTDIPGTSMSYKRKVFEQYGHFIEGTYCSDTDFHWRLRQNGYLLQFVPSILVFHHNIDKFGIFFKHEFVHGRSFGQVRLNSQNFSKLRRSIYVILFFLIPLKLLLGIGLSNFKNRIYLSLFLKASPLLILGIISWSLGECAAYIGGEKNEKSS